MKEGGKLTFKQVIRAYKRACGIINKALPNFFVMSIISALTAASQPIIALFFSARILNELTGAKDIKSILTYVVLTVVLTFMLSAIGALMEGKLNVQKSENILEKILGERYTRLDYNFVEDNRINDRLKTIIGKAWANTLGLVGVIYRTKDLFECLFSILFSIILLLGMFSGSESSASGFITSPYASALMLIMMVLILVLMLLPTRWMNKKLNIAYDTTDKVNTLVQFYDKYADVGNGAKELRLYNQKRLTLSVMEEWKKNKQGNMVMHTFEVVDGISAAASTFLTGLTYIFIGLRALLGMYGHGFVVQYVGAISSLYNNANKLISQISKLLLNVPYLEMMYEYLDLPNVKYQGTIPVEKRRDNEYDIEFHDVSFKYPGSDTYALKHLNIRFDIGQRLAVVGMNGSGKTTMIKLLCRLYDPSEGVITLNGIDIKKYNYDEYMGIFSTVFQDFQLLAFTLGQNVATDLKYDERRVFLCLEKVGFAERLETLEDGLDTYLYKEFEEGGVNISGGEAQKIALARALYRDAPFIVLDEPTAALDPLAEFEIYSHFDSIVDGKTAVYISHRLSSCRFCNDIAVFHEGEMVQRGSHSELLDDEEGKYYELWHAQAQYYAEHDISI